MRADDADLIATAHSEVTSQTSGDDDEDGTLVGTDYLSSITVLPAHPYPPKRCGPGSGTDLK